MVLAFCRYCLVVFIFYHLLVGWQIKNMKYKLWIIGLGLAMTASLQEPAFCEELKPIAQKLDDADNFSSVLIWWISVFMILTHKSPCI
jgi:hypothetical protein